MLLLVSSLYPITLAVLYLAFTLNDIALPSTQTAAGHVIFGAAVFVLPILFLPVIIKNCVQLALATWYGLRQRASEDARSEPSVSVVIPAWNEEVGIVATIRSVLATGYPRLEVIVVNDGSTDGTDEVVRAFIAGHAGPPIRYRRMPNGGKAKALNVGLAIAQGEIVVTVDADSVMERDFLRNVTAYLDRHDVAAAAGKVVIGNGERPIGLLQQLEYLSGFYFKRAEAVMGAVYIVGGAAAAYRRRVVLELGGFDHSIITEDIELSMRLQHHGHRVGYCADALVYTEGPSDFTGLCRQRLRWKHGRLQTFWRYRALFASLRTRHSKYLSLFVLPMALYGEALLLAWPLVLPVSLATLLVTHDVVLLAALALAMNFVIWIQILVDRKRREHGNLAVLAPVAWLLFSWVDLIECQALLRSLVRIATGQAVRWQHWQRQGVFGDSLHGRVALRIP